MTPLDRYFIDGYWCEWYCTPPPRGQDFQVFEDTWTTAEDGKPVRQIHKAGLVPPEEARP